MLQSGESEKCNRKRKEKVIFICLITADLTYYDISKGTLSMSLMATLAIRSIRGGQR